MVSFILIISFLLHIIALTAIFQLKKQVEQFQKPEDTNDILEVFETYLQEIKEENKRLQEDLLKKTPKEYSDMNDVSHLSVANDTTTANHPSSTEKPYETILPEDDKDDTVESSLQAHILQLHNKGLPTSEIAQRLNCGKTEAELTIKLYKKA
ncbi:hypothetical protein QGM71_04050 [Virgibacillus sp. C22-A2]|uniref:Coupling factor for flagellin transcription and translation n=1 Tax=Virgibacillus tibetensis TaxID=3042313 RepID=A0ABU6KC80_9BACI|nr:hypothetical protein [Virgibacillus sp. C22-A2]